MKFDTFLRSGFFYELMNSSDKKAFADAFAKREVLIAPADETEAKKIKAGLAKQRTRIEVDTGMRKWVRDVVDMLATQLEIPLSVAIQAIKTGDAYAIERYWRRQYAAGNKSAFIARMMNPKEPKVVHVDDDGNPVLEKIPVIDQGPINYIRDRWSWCLTISKPSY